MEKIDRTKGYRSLTLHSQPRAKARKVAWVFVRHGHLQRAHKLSVCTCRPQTILRQHPTPENGLNLCNEQQLFFTRSLALYLNKITRHAAYHAHNRHLHSTNARG